MIASNELRKRQQRHSEGLAITAKRLGAFLQSIEADELVMTQRLRDREAQTTRSSLNIVPSLQRSSSDFDGGCQEENVADERSIGCVGVLKQWLIRALSVALRTGETTLSRRNLENQAPSIAQADKMISEASEGEMRLIDSNEAALRLRQQLGLVLPTQSQSVAAKQSESAPGPQTIRRPGQRRPTRDIIGTRESLHAARV
jgi:hypothetical protein